MKIEPVPNQNREGNNTFGWTIADEDKMGFLQAEAKRKENKIIMPTKDGYPIEK